VTGVFGVRGELKCTATSAGETVLAAGRSYALDPEGKRWVRCSGLRRHQNRSLVSFEGVTTPEEARELVGRELFADRADIALEADEYLDEDLIGLRLLDPAGKALGSVVGVEHLPAQDCLVVGEKRSLVPLITEFVRSIDVAKGEIVVDLPAGLLD
jgi:16S rRNA processing protein RimM